jgi:hypothetical protein
MRRDLSKKDPAKELGPEPRKEYEEESRFEQFQIYIHSHTIIIHAELD